MKTKLSLAISAALISGACFAGAADKYNTTNQVNNEYDGVKATKFEIKQNTPSAWMIKLTYQSVSQQNRLSNTDFSRGVSLVFNKLDNSANCSLIKISLSISELSSWIKSASDCSESSTSVLTGVAREIASFCNLNL